MGRTCPWAGCRWLPWGALARAPLLWKSGVVAEIHAMLLPQVAGGLRGEEAAVVPVELCGGDGQPRSPGAREGGECRAMRGGTRQSHTVTQPLSLAVHSHSPEGPQFPGHTCCLCCHVCACGVCLLRAHGTPPSMHVYGGRADAPVGFALHSTWTRTAPWGTCSGGSWMCRLVRLVSPHPVFQPTVPSGQALLCGCGHMPREEARGRAPSELSLCLESPLMPWAPVLTSSFEPRVLTGARHYGRRRRLVDLHSPPGRGPGVGQGT